MKQAAGDSQSWGSASYIKRLNALDMRTYCIGNRKAGEVKIGRSVDVVTRRNELQTGYPRMLNILRVERGDKEAYYHWLFAAYRLKGEWFTLSPEIQEWLDSPMEAR
jgi:hypothetical protein